MSKRKTPITPTRLAPEAPYRFSARLFHAVALFRAQQDIRYYLNGVCFFPHPSGGAMLAATNGHQMAVAYDPEGAAPEQRIVSVCPALETAAGRHHQGWVHTDAELTSRVIVSTSKTVEVYVQPGRSLVEGKFPNIFDVMPKDPSKLQPAVLGAVNALYYGALAAMTKRLRIDGLRSGNALHHWQVEENSVLVTRPEGEPNIVVLTMPMRGTRPDIVKHLATFQPMPKPPAPAPAPEPAPAPVPEPVAAAEPTPAPVEAPAPDAVQVAISALQAAATALASISAKTKTMEPA
jgi:hypothetical protein